MLKKLFRRAPQIPAKAEDSLQHVAGEALAHFLGAASTEAVSREHINKEIGAATPTDVLRIARKYQKNTRLITTSEELLSALSAGPVLVRWHDPELDRVQYTVFYARDNDMLFLLDPVWGKRRIPKNVFIRNWNIDAKKDPWALGTTS